MTRPATEPTRSLPGQATEQGILSFLRLIAVAPVHFGRPRYRSRADRQLVAYRPHHRYRWQRRPLPLTRHINPLSRRLRMEEP